MRSEVVRFQLSDGASVTLSDEELRQVYETLWGMAREPGAVVAAAIVRGAKTEARRGRVKLPPRESEAFRRAMTMAKL